MKTYTSLNFSPSEEEYLIDEVSKYPALYDSENRDHKDVSVKLNIWKMISEKMNDKSIRDCQKKWKNIRDSYMRFRRRKLKAGFINFDELPESSRYARLAFLDDMNYEKILPLTMDEDNSMCTLEEDSSSEVENISGKYISNKRKAENTIEDLIQQIPVSSNLISPIKTEDEIDYFMCSLANTIKKFSPDLKRKVKMDLLMIVNDYEKKNENEAGNIEYNETT